MSASLGSLPPELYTAILSHIPADSLQQTVLSLTRALPLSPIPLYHLFACIHLKHGDQVVQLYQLLRKALDQAAWVRVFTLETWQVDADVVVNLIRLLSQVVRSLTLFIGPNFAPEHLEEIFEKPMPKLRFISLRFRPYVQRATYYQFLKGAYFDSTLQALSRWPRSPIQALLSLSIVQDPIVPELVQKQHFAQPLVFFQLNPLTTLVCSDYLQSLINFRLRIPGRDYIHFICTYPGPLPALELLDISTSSMMLDLEVEPLLVRFTKLRHLILDGCMRLNMQDIHWWALGNICSLAGVKRAKERRKKFDAWFEANAPRSVATNQELLPDMGLLARDNTRRPKRGRRGLATATISLKEPSAREIDLAALASSLPVDISVPNFRILPPLPSLTSLSIMISPQMPDDSRAKIRADFERGWTEGLVQLTAIRNRLRQSWQNGTRVLRFSEELSVSAEGLEGLVDVESDGADFHVDVNNTRTPVLCLAGPGREDVHVDGCGHRTNWDVWKDDLPV